MAFDTTTKSDRELIIEIRQALQIKKSSRVSPLREHFFRRAIGQLMVEQPELLNGLRRVRVYGCLQSHQHTFRVGHRYNASCSAKTTGQCESSIIMALCFDRGHGGWYASLLLPKQLPKTG